jgi:Cytochrome P460
MILGRRPRLAISLLLALSACSAGCGERPPAQDPAAPGAARPSSPFTSGLLAAAGAYASYGRIGERVEWALMDCAAPGPRDAEYDVPRFSKSGDDATHGQKLYYLYAADRRSYRAGSDGEPAEVSPVGQVVVKEAWIPEEVKNEPPAIVQPNDRIERGGRTYRTARLAGLFVMMKLDPETPGTDQGWVYGTVAADRVTVTSAGLVASCMGCHEDAPFDRLFGADTKRGSD